MFTDGVDRENMDISEKQLNNSQTHARFSYVLYIYAAD